MKLGVETTLGAAHCLVFLAAGRIAAAAMHLHVRRIQETPASFIRGNHLIEQLPQDALAAPTAPVMIHRIPIGLRAIDSPPGTAFAEHKQNTIKHDFYWQRRSPPLTLAESLGITFLWFL